jgi:hypothetical protein
MNYKDKILNQFDEKFCCLYGNKVYVYDRNKGKHILLNSENDAEKIKSFIEKALNGQREEILKYIKAEEDLLPFSNNGAEDVIMNLRTMINKLNG